MDRYDGAVQDAPIPELEARLAELSHVPRHEQHPRREVLGRKSCRSSGDKSHSSIVWWGADPGVDNSGIRYAYIHPKTAFPDDVGHPTNTGPEGAYNSGAGGLHLSAIEYAQFTSSLYSGKLLNKADFDAMHTFVGPKYGLGIHRVPSKKFASIDYYGHGGDSGSGERKFRTRWLSMRETGFHVVVLTNCCDGLDEPDPDNGNVDTELRVWLGTWLDSCLGVFNLP